jgi:hypothetical protein
MIDTWGHRQAQEYMGDRVDQVKTTVEQVEHIIAISYKNITTSYELLPHLHIIAINAIATEIFHYTSA